MAHNEAHNALVRDALQELAINGYTAWRNETGAWIDDRGIPHKFGKKGSADIILILAPNGRHVEAEAKTGSGAQSKSQKIHQEFVVERNGGAYILFRSTAELLVELEKLKVSN